VRGIEESAGDFSLESIPTPGVLNAVQMAPLLRDAGPSAVAHTWAEVVDLHGDKPTAAQVREVVETKRPTAALMVQSAENEWYTPARYIEHARAVLGAIDLDPASCLAANRTVRAATFYAIDTDGLAQDWQGRVWLNPPYGRLAGDFTRKLLTNYETGNVTAAIALVNAHCTDTGWFGGLWDHALCFTDHRIDFDSGERGKQSSSTHGSVFAYLGPDTAKFADIFSAFGAVVSRWSS
jgi:phage N-6-adenine-methyltransferase